MSNKDRLMWCGLQRQVDVMWVTKTGWCGVGNRDSLMGCG